MINQNKFNPIEINHMKKLLSIEVTIEDLFIQRINEEHKACVFFNLLSFVLLEKYIYIKNENNKKTNLYINRGDENQKLCHYIFNKLYNSPNEFLNKDLTTNSIIR